MVVSTRSKSCPLVMCSVTAPQVLSKRSGAIHVSCAYAAEGKMRASRTTSCFIAVPPNNTTGGAVDRNGKDRNVPSVAPRQRAAQRAAREGKVEERGSLAEVGEDLPCVFEVVVESVQAM